MNIPTKCLMINESIKDCMFQEVRTDISLIYPNKNALQIK